jgi:pimeloyl-ACP methyl ester carboxylesterase
MRGRVRALRRRGGALTATCAAASLLLAACTTTAANTTTTTPPASTTTTATTSVPTTGVPTTTVPLPPVNKLAWQPCDGQFLCSSLVVPISYSAPQDGTIRLAVIEAPSTGDPSTARDLVMNPGGPGAAGVGFLESAASAFSALREQFNLVSFDPRGIGESEPVTCTTPAGMRAWMSTNPAPAGAREIAQAVAEVKSFDAACAKSVPADVLANLSTAVTARDMDRLRQALGQAKLDYLGFSYGTYLGTLYAQSFPSKVGALVLDGAIDPSLSAAAADTQQSHAFEVDLQDFFAWCKTNSPCAGELPEAPATYSSLMGRLFSGSTIAASLPAAFGGNQQANFAVIITGIVSTLYSTNTWPQLASGLAAAAGGNATQLTQLAWNFYGFNADGTLSNLISANIAISCLDRPPPPVSAYPGLAKEFAKSAPYFGPTEAWGTLPCNYWHEPATGGPMTVHLPRPLPILVVGSTHDPATPYTWAVALTRQLRGAELLTRTGDGHTGYFASGCVDQWVDGFLETLARPPVGTVCPSN